MNNKNGNNGNTNGHKSRHRATDKAKSDLAFPRPRNCDRFGDFESAQKAFLRETHSLVVDDKIFDWLFAPSAKQEGGAK